MARQKREAKGGEEVDGMDGMDGMDKAAGVKRWKGVVTVRLLRYEGMGLRLTKVPCGKKRCTKCPHGPYWYLEFRSRGKWCHKYVGKSLTGERVAKDATLARMVELIQRSGREVKCDAGADGAGVSVGGADGGIKSDAAGVAAGRGEGSR